MSYWFGATPLRLTDLERQKLQLVIAGLKVSEYTDDVDDFRRPHTKEGRMVTAIEEFFDTITGLAIASDAIPKSVRDALKTGNTRIATLVPLLEELFEIVRRHKRLNPQSHRGEYGKLVMLLQDVQKTSVRRSLGIQSTLVLPIRAVGEALKNVNCSLMLTDPDFIDAYLSKHGAEKQAGFTKLLERYGAGNPIKTPVVELCLRSIDDVWHFLRSNVEPLQTLRSIVQGEFERMEDTSPFNIAITAGRGEARFTHSHRTHCQYVQESLLLWELVQGHILNLWEVAEDDMLVSGGGAYDFVNTGQGYHRLCRAPSSYVFMSDCVSAAEKQMGGWVGIKVIHLGDRDVPNPLVFIDKYSVIPLIVRPIVHAIGELRRIFSEDEGHSHGSITYPGLRNLLRAKYHSYEELRLVILSDFFKHAFDGSGDDGGSCIDGRLTSAWNWCHKLHKKPYYDAFILTGFTGFD